MISEKDNELFFLFNSVLNQTDSNVKNNLFFSPLEIIPKHSIKEKQKEIILIMRMIFYRKFFLQIVKF
ncbi:MAG: hypothetical protein CM1200mP33_1540 [Chloroflexota bacterium]|nr:MAG: hypothetical protein CM1200mP33_1540 [Chloroflexota bacterium]